MGQQTRTRREKFFLWLDAEMTGLDIDHDELLEVAAIMTDVNLNIIAEGPELVIYQPEFMLQRMGEWCWDTHKKSGLVREVRKSQVTTADAERELITFVKDVAPAGIVHLAGNSVYQDKAFIRRLMPRLDALFHYRVIDVSTVKELGRAWYPDSPGKDFLKPDNHRALEDIRSSINELKHYRKYFFRDAL